MGTTRHTPEVVEAILAAWRAGATYDQAGKAFGLNKGMVAGIVERNKEPGEERVPLLRVPPAADSSGPAITRLARWNNNTGMPLRLARMAKMASGARFRECQWIPGEPSADDACKCGAKTGRSRVYCPEHEARAWPAAQAGESAAQAGEPAAQAGEPA